MRGQESQFASPAARASVRYNPIVAQPKPLPDLPESVRDLADQRARVRAMLDRWAGHEVSDEPEWNVADLHRMRLREPPASKLE